MHKNLSFIFSRRSVREFAPGSIPESAIKDLLEAAMAAPSACCKDPWHFVVVRGPERLAALSEGLPNGRFLARAAAGLVVRSSLPASTRSRLRRVRTPPNRRPSPSRKTRGSR